MVVIDYVIIGVVLLILGSAGFYIARAKKRGAKCIGCPDSGTCACAGCKENCSCCGGKDHR